MSSTSLNASATYSYDGNSLRVQKCLPNCTSPTSTTGYIFSGSKVVAEYENGAAPGSPTREYVYSGSQLLATIESSVVKYQISDHLSARVTTDSTGTVIGQQGHYPYGEVWYETGTTTKWPFTSYERDTESGNDYALARYYVNRLGRFNSPDPLAGSISDPQSLNRYAYVRNDAINLVDPLGLQASLMCLWLMSEGGPIQNCWFVSVVTDSLSGRPSGPPGGLPWGSGSINELFGGQDLFIMTWDLESRPADSSGDGPGGDSIIPSVPWVATVSIGPVVLTAAWIPKTNTVCLGGGLGYGFTLAPHIPFSASVGPLPIGTLQNAKDVLSRWSLSGRGQDTSFRGAQAVLNPSGRLAGPTAGTPGAEIGVTYSACKDLGR